MIAGLGMTRGRYSAPKLSPVQMNKKEAFHLLKGKAAWADIASAKF